MRSSVFKILRPIGIESRPGFWNTLLIALNIYLLFLLDRRLLFFPEEGFLGLLSPRLRLLLSPFLLFFGQLLRFLLSRLLSLLLLLLASLLRFFSLLLSFLLLLRLLDLLDHRQLRG